MKQFTVNKTLSPTVVVHMERRGAERPVDIQQSKCSSLVFVCEGCVFVWFSQEDEYLSGFLNRISLLISSLQSLSLSYHSPANALLHRLYIHPSTEHSCNDSSILFRCPFSSLAILHCVFLKLLHICQLFISFSSLGCLSSFHGSKF